MTKDVMNQCCKDTFANALKEVIKIILARNIADTKRLVLLLQFAIDMIEKEKENELHKENT